MSKSCFDFFGDANFRNPPNPPNLGQVFRLTLLARDGDRSQGQEFNQKVSVSFLLGALGEIIFFRKYINIIDIQYQYTICVNIYIYIYIYTISTPIPTKYLIMIRKSHQKSAQLVPQICCSAKLLQSPPRLHCFLRDKVFGSSFVVSPKKHHINITVAWLISINFKALKANNIKRSNKGTFFRNIRWDGILLVVSL